VWQVKGDDKVFEKDGVAVVVDTMSLGFLRGATIDYSEELIRASFQVVDNPNAESGCGCGASFVAK
jgi:iron-sulfur cluster assembly accessory protein